MAEEFGDKTEDPTPKKREEAREQGNIARSPDLTAATLLVGSLMLLHYFGEKILIAMCSGIRRMLSEESLGAVNANTATEGLASQFTSAAVSLVPLFGGIVLIAFIVNVAQVGFHLLPSKLAPNFEALNPVRGLGKLFQSQGMMRLVMGLLKMTLVGMAAYSAIHARMSQIIGIERLDYLQFFHLGGEMVYSIGMRVGLLLLTLALIDYFWQRHSIEQSLKMTKQEVKDEHKRDQGDPKLKMRRRQIAQQIAQRKLAKDVPTADVVITNPTEFAIALKYDPKAMHAPRVVAKGQDLMAKRIRELAIAAGVPILERKPLARAMYGLVDVGQEIPEEFYSAIAEILAYVYELTGKVRRAKV